ncbi:MAG: exodeoxyribonuclease VII large subunit [Anaerolineae bacterium]|nr:MAG: exodeoxyribonuclease VII large subunit [Anaerolineae bacterium]
MSLFNAPATGPQTVSEVTAHIKEVLESEDGLQDVWVRGEVSNFSRPSSGHLYFTLKDSGASLSCVMWRGQASRLAYVPREGDAVEVHGGISVYEARGNYQLYADDIRPAGEGALFAEFLRLKALLEAEGLFEPARKRPLPPAPRVIGIVTSPTGAALRDMLNVLRRRYPLARAVLAPAAVQGESAPREIIAAIQRLNQFVKPDLIIAGRGGGSIEDLWAFNDEGVARAIAASAAPVISAVGHETDFTIADFVADLRAPTPTAAAELATPDRADLRDSLLALADDLATQTRAAIAERRYALGDMRARLNRRSPEARLAQARQRVDDYAQRAALLVQSQTRLRLARLAGLAASLEALSPRGILERGYAVVTGPDGAPVRRVAQVKSGDALRVRVSDGEFGAEVKK